MSRTACLSALLLAAWTPIAVWAGEAKPLQVVDGWGVLFDPDGDCQVQKEGDKLRIVVPGTLHGLSPSFPSSNAPRLLQAVEGDFTIQVKVTGEVAAEPGTAIARGGGSVAFRRGGLVVWHDRKNFILLDRLSLANEKSTVFAAAFLVFQDGELTASSERKIENRETWLRLARHGGMIEAAASRDEGKTWVSLGSEAVTYPAKVKVGVAALHATTKPFTAEFAQFKLSTGKP